MRDKADAWQMEITSLSWEFEKLLEELGPEEINFRPKPKSWSIAENLAHLIRLNESYYPIFDSLISGQYKPTFVGKIPFLVNSMGNLLYRTMGSKIKTKTLASWEPSQKQYDLDVVADFNKHQVELSAYIQKLDPFFESGLVIHSPANRWVVYSLDKAIEIIISHEKRHLEQARNIFAAQKTG